MNRKEFIDKLEGLLRDIPASERDEALQHYTDYFVDAGEENEAQAVNELGSPEKIAAIIKADLQGSSDSGEFSEMGYSDSRFEKKENPATREQAQQKEENTYSYNSSSDSDNGYSYKSGSGEERQSKSGLKIILIVLAAIVLIPIAIPIFIGGAAFIIGLVFASFGLFAGLVIGSLAIMAAGIGLFILGMTKLLVALPSALLTSGSGLLLFVLGLVATVATVKLCMVIYPAMCRAMVSICRWPFQRKGAI